MIICKVHIGSHLSSSTTVSTHDANQDPDDLGDEDADDLGDKGADNVGDEVTTIMTAMVRKGVQTTQMMVQTCTMTKVSPLPAL